MKTFHHLVNFLHPILVTIPEAMARRNQEEIRGKDQTKDKKVEAEMQVSLKEAVEEKREPEKAGSDFILCPGFRWHFPHIQR